MSATIITLGGTLATATGVKVKSDVLDIAQTLLIHDFSKTATWPSQGSTIPSNTKLVNLATQSSIAAKGFVTSANGFVYSAVNKSITFNGAAGGTSNWLKFQSQTSPYEHLPIEGQSTDLLIIMWLKLTTISGVLLSQYNNGSALGNAQITLPLPGTNNALVPYAIGTSGTYTGGVFPANSWMQIAVYVRTNGYNGKSGTQKHFLNNVGVGTSNITASTFFAEDTTRELLIGAQYGGWYGELGRIAIVKGLDAANLTPKQLVSADWSANRSKWS